MKSLTIYVIFGFVLVLSAVQLRAAPDKENRLMELHTMDPEAFRSVPEAEKEISFSDIDNELLNAAVFHETNRRRIAHKLAPLEFQSQLGEAARIQSREMIRLRKVTHGNAGKNLATPAARIKSEGLDGRYYAENVAKTFGIRYESGTSVYTQEVDGRHVFSVKPGGPPILPHTYLSFAIHLLDEWMASPGHRKNILAEEPESLGISCLHERETKGMDVFYCTQEFYAAFPE